MDYWEYEIRSLVNTASVSMGIGNIQLCHNNLAWGKSGYFRWHTIDIYSSCFKYKHYTFSYAAGDAQRW
jgi:hypothetical protein